MSLTPSSSPESKGNQAYLEGQIVHSWVITVGLRQLHVPGMEFLGARWNTGSYS